jgi:hypothetical protein
LSNDNGPTAHQIAQRWNEQWQRVRRGLAFDLEVVQPHRKIYPARTVGEAYERYRRTPEWVAKKPRTREDWERGWKYIEPIFGMDDPKKITMESMSQWYRGDGEKLKGLLNGLGVREAHRAMKIWRALWQVMAAMKYCHKDEDPSFGIRRVTPKARRETWMEGAVVRLAKAAIREGYPGLACIIAVGWDTSFSPVDLRSLTPRMALRDGDALAFYISRTKTSEPAYGRLSARSTRLVEEYVAALDLEIMPDAPIFRNRSKNPYSKDTLGDDFRAVRTILFGLGEKRQLQDFRRSGSVEALAGEVDLEALGNRLGNSIQDNKALQRTYLPLNLEASRRVDDARLRGRRLQRHEQTETKKLEKFGLKVGNGKTPTT